MHTTVLVLGILLLLSELGAIGFITINTIRHFTQPKLAISLMPDKSLLRKRTLKITVIENKRARSSVINIPNENALPKEQPNAGYFSLTP